MRLLGQPFSCPLKILTWGWFVYVNGKRFLTQVQDVKKGGCSSTWSPTGLCPLHLDSCRPTWLIWILAWLSWCLAQLRISEFHWGHDPTPHQLHHKHYLIEIGCVVINILTMHPFIYPSSQSLLCLIPNA